MSRKRPIELETNGDEDQLDYRKSVTYVLEQLQKKLPGDVAQQLAAASGGSSADAGERPPTIHSAKLSTTYDIVIAKRITKTLHSKDTLDSLVTAIVTEIDGKRQSIKAAEQQLGDAARHPRLKDILHSAQSALLPEGPVSHSAGPPIELYEAFGLQPVVANDAYDESSQGKVTLKQCARFVTPKNANQTILFHGSTMSCKDGLCKLFPKMGPSQGKVTSSMRAYGEGFYLTPYFNIALYYACDRAKNRTKEREAIVLEVLVSDIDKLGPADFGGTCGNYVVIRPSKIGHISIIRIHQFDRQHGKWCPM